MALCYKKLWKLLIDHDMNRAALREAIGASPTTLAKMTKGEAVGASVLEKICEVLHCNIGDVVDYIPGSVIVTGAISPTDEPKTLQK